MFLNWWLVTRVVAAAVVDVVDYPPPEEFFLAYNGNDKLFTYGSAKPYASNVAIYFNGYKYPLGNTFRGPIYPSEPGSYQALVDICDTRYLTDSITVSNVSSSQLTLKSNTNTLNLANTSSNSLTSLLFNGVTYGLGSASNIFVNQNGTYKSFTQNPDIPASYFGNVVVNSNVSGTESYLAFHHGNFDNAYSDGSVTNALKNKRIYADTPVGTYTFGTLNSVVTTGTSTTYSWTPADILTADIAVVGGGGGGSSGTNSLVWGSGGGGGEVRTILEQELPISPVEVVVGAGGAAAPNAANQNGFNGTGSSFGTILTAGPGLAGLANGSGGDSGSGNAGAVRDGLRAGGGGGDAAAAIGGNGGDGTDIGATFGTEYGENGFFGGGGAGVNGSNGARFAGGLGGGADSPNPANSGNGVPGTPHTGGGGSERTSTVSAGTGGSGIVLLKTRFDKSKVIDNKIIFDSHDEKYFYKGSELYDVSSKLPSTEAVYDFHISDTGDYVILSKGVDEALLIKQTVTQINPTYTAPHQIVYDGVSGLYVDDTIETDYISYRSASDNKHIGCGVDKYRYILTRAGGSYKADVYTSNSLTLTNTLTIPTDADIPLYRYPPWKGDYNATLTNRNVNANNEIVVYGAEYGNGSYISRCNRLASLNTTTIWRAFNSDKRTGFENLAAVDGIITIDLPEPRVIGKYMLWALSDTNGRRPVSWVLQAYDGTSYIDIDTVTSSPILTSGSVFTPDIINQGIYRPFKSYRLSITALDGGTGIQLAEFELWGYEPFDLTFTDGFDVNFSNTATIAVGSSNTDVINAYTSSLDVSLSGNVNIDTSIQRLNTVVYSPSPFDHPGIMKKIYKTYEVKLHTIAFHYTDFSITDYGGKFKTVQEATYYGYVYPSSSSGVYSWGEVVVGTSNTTTATYEFTPGVSSMTVDVAVVGGGGSGSNGTNGLVYGSGGGGGQVRVFNSILLTDTTSTSVSVGAGGAPVPIPAGDNGNDGNSSSFGVGRIAIGGRGGDKDGTGGESGSGNAGGPRSGLRGGGGGGDAVAAGTDGNGGDGTDLSATFGTEYGENGFFGGGGAGHVPNVAFTGGLGGGADQPSHPSYQGVPGDPHTGGGGSERVTGDGGSGVVIIRRTS